MQPVRRRDRGPATTRAARPVRVSLPGAVPVRRRQGQRCPAAAGPRRAGWPAADRDDDGWWYVPIWVRRARQKRAGTAPGAGLAHLA